MVLGQHEDLAIISRRLRTACASLGHDSLPVGGELTDLVCEFCARLSRHFATEEAYGYFGTLVADCPSLKDRVTELVLEHDSMREMLDELRALAEDPKSVRVLARRVSSLLDMLQAHERVESLLLQEFFSTEDRAEH